MKRFSYSCSTNTIWLSFDYGEVEAENESEALELAKQEIETKLEECNDCLYRAGIGSRIINIDYSQIEIKQVLL